MWAELLFSSLSFVSLAPASSAYPAALRVVGTQVETDKGKIVHLHGVNAASLEWTSDGEGHILNTVNVAIRGWHANIIRLPLSQDRWFGKAPEQRDGGASYRKLVRTVVDAVTRQNCYIILDLHWSDANQWGKNIGQHIMPDENSAAFWKDLAPRFKDNAGVIFDLYNEPHDTTWAVWQNGGEITETDRRTRSQLKYRAVGLQQLLNTVRSTGAKNVVIAGGLNWAYDMSGFLNGRALSDPHGRGVIYANHDYPIKGETMAQWLTEMERAAAKLPVIVDEFGTESGRSSVGPNQWVLQVLAILKEHDWNWVAWDLHPAAGPRLVSGWDYAPTPSFGSLVKRALSEENEAR